MDDASLERLARLRGIGDAYYDFRGQLRYFSLETKAGILRAMGAIDAQGAHAGEGVAGEAPAAAGRGLEQSSHRVRPAAVRRRTRPGAELDPAPRGRPPPAGLAPRLGLPRVVERRRRRRLGEPAPVRTAGRTAGRLSRSGGSRRGRARRPVPADHRPGQVLRAVRDQRGGAPVGRDRAALYAALPAQLGDRRFRRPDADDPLAGAARRRIHRRQSAARAGAGRPGAGRVPTAPRTGISSTSCTSRCRRCWSSPSAARRSARSHRSASRPGSRSCVPAAWSTTRRSPGSSSTSCSTCTTNSARVTS